MDKSEAIKKGLDKLVEVSKKPLQKGGCGTGGDNAFYGAVCHSKDGSFYVKYNQHPCHFFMGTYRRPIVVFNRFCHREELSEKARRKYFDWITSDTGPWREFYGRNISHVPEGFVGSTADFVYQTGWVWSELEKHPANLQHSFLTAARMPAEWPILIEKWSDWVEKGINPALAFLFLDLFKPQVSSKNYWCDTWGHTQNKASDMSNWQINRQNRYDWPVDVCTASEEYILNFMNGRVERLKKPYSETSSYKPVNRIFGNNGLDAMGEYSYPTKLFQLYSSTHGPSAAEAEEIWKKKGSMFSAFDFQKNWVVSEEELLDIIRKEEVRLNGYEESRVKRHGGKKDVDPEGKRRARSPRLRDSKGRFSKPPVQSAA